MLYTLVGNGSPNKRELIASLDSLAEAAVAKDGDFWMILVDEEPSPAKQSIINWLDQNSYYYEIVSTAEDRTQLSGEYSHLGVVHRARRPVQRALSITPARAAVDEPYSVLVMSDNLDEDEDCLLAVAHCVDNGVPVFDLAGQMTPLTVDEETSTSTITVEEKPSSAAPDLLVSRGDLEALTRDELKSLVVARNLGGKVSDMRSKDAMIDALLGNTAPSEPPSPQRDEEPVEPPSVAVQPSEEPDEQPSEASYFLITVRGPGDSEIVSVDAKQALRLFYPDQD